jgi:hypothetical protein
MANTLTSLIPDLYESLDTVLREQVGLIPAVSIDASLERAALSQTIRSFVAPASSASDVTPGLYAPDDGNQSIANKTITISKSRYVPIRWNGEEQVGINSGPGYMNVRKYQMMQAMRTLCNEVETDLAALHIGASRAYGTYNTLPFASTLGDPAQVRKILADNGCPLNDLQMVIDSSSGAAMRTLAQLTKANEAGGSDLLRRGVLLDIHGFAIRESKQIKQAVAVGTGANYVSNHATYPVGTTSINIDVGTGTILAGDIITFAGDSNKYVVATGFAGDGAGTIVIANPGLQATLADDVALSIVGATNRNMAFDRNAIALVTRSPALPGEGDMAEDSLMLQDPVSGLGFEVRMYKQYRQVKYELALAWGCAVMKAEDLALLIG